MAFCPYCGYSVPVRQSRMTCPNCGRKKVKLRPRRPISYTTVSAYQERHGKDKANPAVNSLLVILLFCGTFLFLYAGIWIRGLMGIWFDILAIFCGIAAIHSLSGWLRSLFTDFSPAKGYIDHLQDLAESRATLVAKIEELRSLQKNQKKLSSGRAENRLALINAALENRILKLDLVKEGEFVIKSRRKIARIQALAQDFNGVSQPEEIEKEINSAFADLSSWMSQAPSTWRTPAGKKIQRSLEATLAFQTSLREQVEDLKVLTALSEEGEKGESIPLERVHQFIEQSSFDTEWDALETAESLSAEEDYIRINTELRLARDGIKHDFAGETSLELESD